MIINLQRIKNINTQNEEKNTSILHKKDIESFPDESGIGIGTNDDGLVVKNEHTKHAIRLEEEREKVVRNVSESEDADEDKNQFSHANSFLCTSF